jgi:hypothetical protein
VVEAQPPRVDSAAVLFGTHVRTREQRRAEPDEGGERDQEHVEGVDEELVVEREDRALFDDARGEQERGEQGREAHGRVQLGRPGAVAGEREQDRPCERNSEDDEDFHR